MKFTSSIWQAQGRGGIMLYVATWDEHDVEDLTYEDLGAMLAAGEEMDAAAVALLVIQRRAWTATSRASLNANVTERPTFTPADPYGDSHTDLDGAEDELLANA